MVSVARLKKAFTKTCPRCESTDVRLSLKYDPEASIYRLLFPLYRCRTCRRHFSVISSHWKSFVISAGFFVLLGSLVIAFIYNNGDRGGLGQREIAKSNSPLATDLEAGLIAEAEKGEAEAQFKLGYSYKKGGDLPHDQNKAEKWLKKAAFQEHPDAQYQLGLLYEEQASSRFSSVESKEIVRLFLSAAGQGHAEAQLQLGLMYREGHEVRQDYEEAFKWFELASQGGSAEAFHHLGLMYMLGQGISKNIVEAYVCFNLAAANGYKKAIDARSDVAKFLSQKEIAHAQALSRERESAIRDARPLVE